MKLNIFGSCVTRDAFDFQGKHDIEPNVYIARQSIISSVSKPINISEEDVNIASSFRKKMVLSDLLKTAFKELDADPGDGIIIDLIDERFPLIDVNGSYITNSSELQESKLFVDNKVVNKVPYKSLYSKGYRLEYSNRDIEIYIKKFAKEIKKIYRNRTIFIHRAECCNKYLGNNGEIMSFSESKQRINEQSNQLLQYMYSCLIKCLPSAIILDLSGKYVADAKHKWGLAPFHYQEKYYVELMELIGSIMLK